MPFGKWIREGRQSASDLALKEWREIMKGTDVESTMTPEAEQKIKAMMDRALAAIREGGSG